jgi:hypothetical protein
MILGIFLKDPFYLDYNSAGQKTMFSIFFTFGVLRTLKRIWKIFYASFNGKGRPGALEPHLEG